MFFLETLNLDQKQHSFETIKELSLPSKRYYILTVLGVIIATFGILLNNSSIIIGAMLVAPLMLPILGFSISIITGHTNLLIKSFNTLIKGIVLSIIIATFISLFVPIYELPHEVINRTRPTILDLFIALAAGAAAMYATVKKDSGTLPGVAISVSLMPPLSAVGIGLATRNFNIASGAALLFLTNLVAIVFSGIVILFLFGFRPYNKDQQGILKQGAIVNILLLIVISMVLTTSFINVSQEEKKRFVVKDELIRQLNALNKGNLESFKIENQKGEIIIKATILSSKNLTKSDMEVLTNALVYRLEQSVNLEATIIPIALGGKVLPESEKEEIQKEKKLNPELSQQVPVESPIPLIAPMEPKIEESYENTTFNIIQTPFPQIENNIQEESFPFPEN